MQTEGILFNGWKSIMKVFDVDSIKNMKKKAKKHRTPISYIDGRPAISKKDLELWLENVNKEIAVMNR